MPRPLWTHVAVRCANLERSIAFYREWCGLQPIHSRGGHLDSKGHKHTRVAWMGNEPRPGMQPEFVIVLLETDEPPGPTSLFDHLGFALDSREKVDAIAARGKAAGILHWPTMDHGGVVGYLCGLRDPDGNVVEFSFGQALGPE